MRDLKCLKQRVWVWLTRLSISIHPGMFIVPVIKLFRHLSELTIENEENRKPGRRRRWVAGSIICTYTNQHTYYETEKFIYLLCNRMRTTNFGM